MINHNILAKIIDKVALIRWKNKKQEMNNIYKNISITSLLLKYGYMVLHGCLHCGSNYWMGLGYIYFPHQIYYCNHCGRAECSKKTRPPSNKNIYQIKFVRCNICHKNKCTLYQIDTQYKKFE